MGSISSDQFGHEKSIFNHIDRLGKEACEIFKREIKDGKISGPIPASRVENWYGGLLFFESLLISYLGEGEYIKRTKEKKSEFRKLYKEGNLMEAYEKLNEILQLLMIEADNHGLLIKQSVEGEWVASEENEEEH